MKKLATASMIFLPLILLGGCGQRIYWTKTGATVDTLSKDREHCRKSLGESQATNALQAEEACMTGKGYKLSSFPAGSTQSYNATLFNKITPLVRVPPRPQDGKSYQGQLRFSVAADGQLLSVNVHQASGLPELDTSATDAVRKAAPFPPPPGGTPIQLYLKYAPR